METNCWVMSEMAELELVEGVGLEVEIYSINLGTSCRPRLYHTLPGRMGLLLKSRYLHLIVYYMILLHYVTRQNRFTETGR